MISDAFGHQSIRPDVKGFTDFAEGCKSEIKYEVQEMRLRRIS